MVYPSVTFDSPQGAISIAQTGPATAALSESGGHYELGNIAVSADGFTLSCDVVGQPMGILPHLVFQLFKDDLRATVSKSWFDDGVTDYAITDADAANIEAFIKSANFLVA